ncbi:hypothetical protein EAS62_26095 [Bradyrhizobium zhanjiangense]|uniref:Uncharacterized protein n=1 Tax=Bradyrhizobium zhanjiangense TaxID=1325107 RepID=A0ABY0DFN1_9BRAD|nr:hypothetical protein EAS62_26095 [Bradyrhizobium zhanjiangense]
MRGRRRRRSDRVLLNSVAFEDPCTRIGAPGILNDQLPILSFQERRSDLTRPDDEVPQAVELSNDDVHLSLLAVTRVGSNCKNLPPSLNSTSVRSAHEKD